jgi:hypothetical protein
LQFAARENKMTDKDVDDNDDNVNDKDNKDFRDMYMDMITDAFADVLEELRSSDTDTLNVDVLVDCLQSGLELLNQEDKDVLFGGMDDDVDAVDDDDKGQEVKAWIKVTKS